MRETRADTRVAFVAALALHALLFALLFVGMWWTRTTAPVSAAGPEIEADLVDPNALAVPLRRALEAPAQREPEPVPVPPEPEPVAPPPQPVPEPRPEDSQVAPQPQAQAPVPVPDTREQERVEREAEAARQAAREQEEKHRQEQIDLTERKRQDEAEKKQRLAQQAQQQEIARKLEKIRAEREKAKRAADLAEQKLKQIADARAAQETQPSASTAAPPPGNNGVDQGLLGRYKAALNAAILQQWTRPDSVQLGQRCVIHIRQIPGGQVISAQVDSNCPYDDPGRRSVEAAVLKARPLPYAGFESVFRRDL
ncbi:MAG TPA: cell envelope integrity protein TolA, partial [Luteimonas sp.]|nr:cell envelope integrity protein TolA [Luteimonas sp.]